MMPVTATDWLVFVGIFIVTALLAAVTIVPWIRAIRRYDRYMRTLRRPK